MKKTEAIEYIKKNCYGEWCEDDWREAMDMAIEALKSSERTVETIQSNHIAESGRMVERTAETAQNVQSVDDALTLLDSIRSGGRMMYSDYCALHDAISSISVQTVIDDTVSRKAAIDALKEAFNPSITNFVKAKIAIDKLSSAQPDNQINLCDSCDYSYPECPSEKDDVIFGNGIGNDNICACNKYQPTIQPEIVRCKDCEYFRIIDYNELECVHPELRVYTPDFEFGCISGKRRTDEK